MDSGPQSSKKGQTGTASALSAALAQSLWEPRQSWTTATTAGRPDQEEENEMATKSRPWLGPLLGFVFGLMVAGAGLYFTVIKSGDRAVAAGIATSERLTLANAKLASDLASAQSSASELTARLAERQRVINNINVAVRQLSEAGLANGLRPFEAKLSTEISKRYRYLTQRLNCINKIAVPSAIVLAVAVTASIFTRGFTRLP